MWCPKCKLEYREGITVCKDCGTALVEEEPVDMVDICTAKDEAIADKLIGFLEYSELTGAVKQFNEEDSTYSVFVPKTKQKKADKYFEAFLEALEEEKIKKQQEERERQLEEDDEEDSEENEAADEETDDEDKPFDWDADEQKDIDDIIHDEEFKKEADELLKDEEIDDTKELMYTPAKAYVKKEDEFKDLKFSGITFVIFGLIGGIYLVLSKTGVINISYSLPVFIIICCIFAGFIISGIISILKSGKIRVLIPVEEENTREIKEWLGENVTKELLDSWKDPSITEAENDLLLMSHIRATLIKKFEEYDVAYLEMISEEYYNTMTDEDLF